MTTVRARNTPVSLPPRPLAAKPGSHAGPFRRRCAVRNCMPSGSGERAAPPDWVKHHLHIPAAVGLGHHHGPTTPPITYPANNQRPLLPGCLSSTVLQNPPAHKQNGAPKRNFIMRNANGASFFRACPDLASSHRAPACVPGVQDTQRKWLTDACAPTEPGGPVSPSPVRAKTEAPPPLCPLGMCFVIRN